MQNMQEGILFTADSKSLKHLSWLCQKNQSSQKDVILVLEQYGKRLEILFVSLEIRM